MPKFADLELIGIAGTEPANPRRDPGATDKARPHVRTPTIQNETPRARPASSYHRDVLGGPAQSPGDELTRERLHIRGDSRRGWRTLEMKGWRMTRIKRRRAVFFSLLGGVVVFWVATGVAQAAPPVNLTPPSITGTAAQGQTLNVTQGTWDGTYTITEQWRRCDATGANCKAIAGATGASYTLGAADVGHTIVVAETATNAAKQPSKQPARSAPTAVVIGPPENTGAPTISGTLQEGDVITEIHGTWTNNPTSFSYLWLRCNAGGTGCVSTGVTTQTYTLTAADVGSTMEVAETASNAARPSKTAFSAPTGIVTAPTRHRARSRPQGSTEHIRGRAAGTDVAR